MKDVSLDDLIKEDRQKQKLKRRQHRPDSRGGRRGGHGGKRFIRREQGPVRKGSSDGNKPERRFPKGNRQGGDRPRKFGNRINRNRDRPRHQRRQNQNKQRQPKKPKQQAPKQQKGRTLKVLGLHPDITNQDLYKLFAAEGALQKCMIEQDNFGRNLPSALVKYHSAEAAKKSIQNLNNKKVMNSVLTVEPYRHTR